MEGKDENMCPRERRSDQKLTLTQLVETCQALSELISGLLGPSGNQAMLMTSAGKTLVTCDGFSLLSAVQLSNPVAKCIVQNLRHCHSVTRDGNKTYIIYLAELLTQIAQIVMARNVQETYRSTLRVAAKLRSFLQEEFVEIVELFVEKIRLSQASGIQSVCLAIKSVLATCLQTCLPHQMSVCLVEILWTFLFFDHQVLAQSSIESVIDQLPVMLKNFDNYLIKVVGQPLHTSEVFDGMLFGCSVNTCLHSTERAMCITAVLVSISFDQFQESVATDCFASSTDKSVVQSFFHKKQNFLEALKAVGVGMIISSGTFPKCVLSMCRDQKITVVQNVDRVRLNSLQELTSACVIHELGQPVDAGVFTASLRKVQVGTTSYFLLKPCVATKTPLALRQIALCTPTEGLSDQVCLALYKSLGALHACFVSPKSGILKPCDVLMAAECPLECTEEKSAASAKVFCVIKAGGTFEALLSSAIMEYYSVRGKQGCGRENVLMGALLQKMLASVPHRLCTNLSFAAWTEMLMISEQSCSYGSVEQAMDISASGALEPVASKLLLVSHVLNQVLQLLCVDTIITAAATIS